MYGALSKREAEVLVHVAHGKTNGEISKILIISESTVKKHLDTIYLKLNASNRPQAVFVAMREGYKELLIPPTLLEAMHVKQT